MSNLTREELFNDIFGSRRPDDIQHTHAHPLPQQSTYEGYTLDPAKNQPTLGLLGDQLQHDLNISPSAGQVQLHKPSINGGQQHHQKPVPHQAVTNEKVGHHQQVPYHHSHEQRQQINTPHHQQQQQQHQTAPPKGQTQMYQQQHHAHQPPYSAPHQPQHPQQNHPQSQQRPPPPHQQQHVPNMKTGNIQNIPMPGHRRPPPPLPSISGQSSYQQPVHPQLPVQQQDSPRLVQAIPQQQQPLQPPPLQHKLRQQHSSSSLNASTTQSSVNNIPSIPEQKQLAPAYEIRPSSQDMKARLQPITTTDPASAPVSQRYQYSPTSAKNNRSPIIQQGINLFSRSSRTVTSPTLNSNGTFSAGGNQTSNNPPSPGRSMSLNSTSFRSFRSFDNLQSAASSNLSGTSKHHTKDSTKKTSSGRIIPQKFEMNNGSTTGLGLKSRSLTSLAKVRRSSQNSLSGQRVSSQGSFSSRTIVTTSSRPPKVYPALLSRVATLFKRMIVLSQHNKDGLEYRDSFTGADAVDTISYIIRTTDRNLALLLGRALDAQKLFHDVTYEHRLRDSSNEIYQFDEVYVNANENNIASSSSSTLVERNSSFSSTTSNVTDGGLQDTSTGPVEVDHTVNGVLTLLTECYSPTCTRDALCYSIACPRRLEQQARLNMKPQGGLKRNESHASLHDEEEKKQLWSHTVPKQLLESLDKREIKRQELIYEVISTERTFIKNLEYIREYWIRPLRESNIIPFNEREKFIRTVFFNVIDILNIGTRFRDALIRRQQVKPVVSNIGDIFLEFIPFFEPFISYNAGQCFAKYELERQKAANPLFKRFIEETERLPESNRLNISSYLSQATTRTVRYNLLLRDIIKATPEDSIDLPDLLKASELIQNLLERINVKVGKAEDRHALMLLKQRLVFRPGEYVDLKLGADNRKILYTAPLKKRNQDKDNQGDIHIYLLDHVLLFVRVKVVNKREQHKVFQKPIPLPLLFVSATEEMPNLRPYMRKLGAYAHVLNRPTTSDSSKYPISFGYVGRRGYELTLYGATNSAQESLISVVDQQQTKLRTTNDIFTLRPLAERFFDISNRINCLVPYDGGRKFLYGTDNGVFMSEVKISGNERVVSKPVKIISKVNVTQLEVLEEYQTLLALADKKLYAWPLEILTSQDKKTGKEIMSHVSFFKVGVCGGKMLVCAAKSDLIRVFEPTDPFSKKMSKKKFKNETREFHFNSEPVSISFLKARLIVGCTKGFEIVSLSDGKIEAILDPADTSLDFITNREGMKPLAIHRISSNFLLSYSDFSFFINKNGWRTRPEWMINWEGIPTNFSLWYPYLLAFEPNFIEIRNVENGELLRVILGENIRLLHMGSQEILYAYENERGYDVVASLDFWDKASNNNEKKKSNDQGDGRLTEIKEE